MLLSVALFLVCGSCIFNKFDIKYNLIYVTFRVIEKFMLRFIYLGLSQIVGVEAHDIFSSLVDLIYYYLRLIY